MRGLVKILKRTASAFLQICTFVIFGGLLAFFLSAFSGSIPDAPKATSRALSEFLESENKTATFTASELSECVYSILIDCAKDKSAKDRRGTILPETPIVTWVGKGQVEICVPFAAMLADKRIALGAFVSLGFDGKKISVLSARIGRAKLPRFVAERIAATLWTFYEPLGVREKYGDKIAQLQIGTDSVKRAVLKK